MNVTLTIGLDHRALYRVETGLLIVPFFASDPLQRGPLAWLDWRLHGLLGRRLRRAREHGEHFPALLACGAGHLRAERVLALEFDERARREASALHDAARECARRCALLNVQRIASALPVDVEPEPAVEALTLGFAQALSEPGFAMEWQLRLIVPEAAGPSALRGLRRVFSDAPDAVEIALGEPVRLSATPGR